MSDMAKSEQPKAKEDTTLIQVVEDFGGANAPARDRCTLTLVAGPLPGSMFTVDGQELVLGRAPKEDRSGRIDDSGLSRRHARVFRSGKKFCVEDLGSTNGTFLNGERLTEPRPIADGDRIHMGKNTMLRVSFQDAAEQQAARRLYEAAVRDPLTQVYNRRYLDERLQGEFAYAARHNTALAVLLLDIDHFKKVNDTYGHQAGDAVLRVVAGALQRMVRIEDLVARYGGEEFAVVARGIDARNAMIFAERVRKTIAAVAIPWEGQIMKLTASLGVAVMSVERKCERIEELVARADHALYQAKELGRNRCHDGS